MGALEHPEAPRLVHEALLYSTPREFAGAAVPFVLDGLRLHESVLVITNELNAGALRRALGDAADDADWADTSVWAPKPIDRIKALHRYVVEHVERGRRQVRIIDESTWPDNSAAAVSELKRFESVCNLLFADLPVWMLCPYNGSLFNHILPDAYRTHPFIRDARVSLQASAGYLEPGEFFKALDVHDKLPPPPPGATLLRFDAPVEARALAVAEATAAGLHPDRIRDLELAVSELATNAIRHGHGGAELTIWTVPDEIICQVSDTGSGMEDRLIGYGEPTEPHIGGWGLLLARRLSDSLEVRTSSSGTIIRLSMDLPGSAHAPL
jgi:anti-sigma regulatory factor (Ser/Thr protein kinase)